MTIAENRRCRSRRQFNLFAASRSLRAISIPAFRGFYRAALELPNQGQNVMGIGIRPSHVNDQRSVPEPAISRRQESLDCPGLPQILLFVADLEADEFLATNPRSK